MDHHRAPAASDRRDALPAIALVGRPNVGKSTFLARATGRFAETANAPGTTVAAEWRRVRAGERAAWLVDLPGTRSLDDRPAGEAPFWEALLSIEPDAILVVADAGALERHLPLVLAARDLGLPVVVAANLADDARLRGIDVDTGRLSQVLGLPVVLTTARTGDGVQEAVRLAIDVATRRRRVRDGLAAPTATAPAPVYPFALNARLDELARASTPGRSLGAAAAA
ncbi:MAG TPA: FeoB small GTPase domain-containing protein, partial [Candidatus Dormibacteraeota bacterium]|nr:FeoB small GTPase domain-containing protein [Candidatus Dormibacteraeota bacterium]